MDSLEDIKFMQVKNYTLFHFYCKIFKYQEFKDNLQFQDPNLKKVQNK